ncbi:MAG: ferrous iron transport protein B [Bacteroidales bacterium]
MRTLNELKQGETAIIAKVKGRGAFRRRIMEMGFVSGRRVKVIRRAPLQDPIEFDIGYNVSLRESEASLIEVCVTDASSEYVQAQPLHLDVDGASFIPPYKKRSRHINIALVGNPNAGKTTIFNQLSGLREKVGNYAGVTIDAHEARILFGDHELHITDLPGTYSISAYSPEELFVRNHILNRMPDVVVNVVDASNLERNLYLTTQLIDMDIRMVIALNMFDELEQKGEKLDVELLSRLLGVPIVPTVGSKGQGLELLKQTIVRVYEDNEPVVRHIHINYGLELEKSIRAIQEVIRRPENAFLTDRISSRFLAIKLLERDHEEMNRIRSCPNHDEIQSVVNEQVARIESLTADSAEAAITDARYGFIAGALRETMSPSVPGQREITQVVDSVLTHRYLGLPIFGLFMWLMFEATFSLGKYPVSWIEQGVDLLADWVQSIMAPGMFRDLLVDGIISGIGGVIVFLPNIVLLYLFIALMEDTGYMARAVFITDKLMHKIGLHGKSFIPMMMGFGCTVPAIMATRTLENRSDRLVTMLITPFMSCSARLPVYVLLISAFFPNHAGSVLFGIYLFGILIAILMALLLKKTLFRQQVLPFVMELPPYRIPTWRVVLMHMWDRAVQYLKKIAGVILVASIVIWALGYFPIDHQVHHNYVKNRQIIEDHYQRLLSVHPGKAPLLERERDSLMLRLEEHYLTLKQENSFIGRIGKFIHPLMQPLGFDWKMSVSVLAGIPGKEVVVSTMAVLYGGGDENSHTLKRRLQQETYRDGPRKDEVVFSPLVALSFMIFILLYFPCMSTVAVIGYESGSWRWGAFVVVYTTVIAYIVSFLVYQLGSLIIA